MSPRILALDIGGTAVKAGVFEGDRMVKSHSWFHSYNSSESAEARTDLLGAIKDFDNRFDAAGLGLAGLVADDISLMRSTVLGSLIGLSWPDFFYDNFGVEVVTADNDADCGAVSEFYQHSHKSLFYIVVGTGIGSAYVAHDGTLPFRLRLPRTKIVTDHDNPIPNDLGLGIGIPRAFVLERLTAHGADPDIAHRVLIDSQGLPLTGPGSDPASIRAGDLGSAVGVSRLFKILCLSQRLEIDHKLFDHRTCAKTVCELAPSTEIAQLTLNLFAEFLGLAIATAQDQVRDHCGLEIYPDIHLGGTIMQSYHLFRDKLDETLRYKSLVSHNIHLVQNPQTNNLQGAGLQARFAWEERYDRH
jgi:predicted NBD/HSP70 family sugar kinase